MINAQTTAKGIFSREKKVDKNVDCFRLTLDNIRKIIRTRVTTTNVVINEAIAWLEIINSSTNVAMLSTLIQ